MAGISGNGISEESINMRDSVKDRILGSTVVDVNTLVWHCASSGILRIDVKRDEASQGTR